MPIVFAGIICEMLLQNMPNDYNYKANYLRKHAKDIHILFLGNSHAYFGINPQYIQSSSFNASYVSQSLNFDLEILKKYDSKWSKLNHIVIPIDYVSFYSRLESGVESWRVKNYTIYYGIYSNYEIAENTEILSNKLNPNLSRIYSYYLEGKPNTVSCSLLGWGTNYNSKHKLDLESTGKSAAKRHLSLNSNNFSENIQSLKAIIEFARINKIRVLLYTPPAYKTYINNLDTVQLNNTLVAVKKIADVYSNVVYYDLLNDSSFVAADYFDADHLNEIGAKKLTLKIDSLLR